MIGPSSLYQISWILAEQYRYNKSQSRSWSQVFFRDFKVHIFEIEACTCSTSQANRKGLKSSLDKPERDVQKRAPRSRHDRRECLWAFTLHTLLTLPHKHETIGETSWNNLDILIRKSIETCCMSIWRNIGKHLDTGIASTLPASWVWAGYYLYSSQYKNTRLSEAMLVKLSGWMLSDGYIEVP